MLKNIQKSKITINYVVQQKIHTLLQKLILKLFQ